MDERSHAGHLGKRRPPAFEVLEARDLPTAPTLLAGPAGTGLARTLDALLGAPPATVAAVAHEPTPHERAREAFVAKFAGSFVTGPGRFTDQATQSFIKGGGTSNAFLHGDLQMVTFTPIDPGGDVTGTAALIVKNVSNSGNLLVLDLQGDTQTLDRRGRPTRLT